jgi:Alr-MurF fusion protein
MAVYQLKDIAEALKGEFRGKANPTISTLITDSRTYFNPEGSLFFAIKGIRHDGHKHLEELYQKGIRSFIVSEEPDYSLLPESCFILVKDTSIALQQLAAWHRKHFDIPVIGVTGSNGKTIIKEWLFQLLETDKKVIRSPKSYNSQVGVPLSVWMMEDEHELAIFEAGISQDGEMQKLKAIIDPTIGIFSNIGEPHQANFIDYKHKISEKLKLFESCEILIYSRDYSLIESQIKTNYNFEKIRLFSWSRKFPADLFISKIEKHKGNSSLFGKYQNQDISIEIPFIDDASIENAIHCWALLLLSFDNETIGKKMKQLSPVAMRLELKEGINNCTIINDSYNSDLGSLSIALDFLNQQHQHPSKTLIISDILQSGKNETGLYKEVSDLVHDKGVSRLIGIGEAISRNGSFFKIESVYFKTTDEFLKALNKESFKNEAILLKGSRTFEFERISNSLQQKAHRTVLEINLNAIVHNLNYFRSVLKPETKIMVMVKAFSYGSGTYEIANVLQYHKVDYLGVAFADEGVELRKAGITIPIVVMNPEEQSFESMIEYNLEPEIYSLRTFHSFSNVVKKFSIDVYPIHIKLETGMNRLGFGDHELPELIKELERNPWLKISSAFSHLAASDEAHHDDFTQQQFDQFDRLSKQLQGAIKHKIFRHILNSAGVERFPDYQLDMVRLGIGLYGISSNGNHLSNVSTLKSKISQIKQIAKGETIGYSRSGVVKRNSVIAIVPIGYSDGLSRKLSNGVGEVLVNNQKVPIIGNICMDMCMIDITKIKASEDDEVIIFGDQLPLIIMAKTLQTIPYEIMTGISKRVKRIYIYE